MVMMMGMMTMGTGKTAMGTSGKMKRMTTRLLIPVRVADH